MITIDELKAKLGGMKTAVDDLRDALSIEASEKRLAELEHQMTMPGFYDDQERSQKIISEMGEVKISWSASASSPPSMRRPRLCWR